MNQILLSLSVFGTFFLGYMVFHLVYFRAFLPVERWVVLRRAYMVYLPLLLIATWLAAKSGEATYPDFYAGPRWTYLAACVFGLWLALNAYLMFYAFVDRSLSIRTNGELELRNNEPISFQGLMDLYSPRSSYLRRLEILEVSGYLEKAPNGRYKITPKGARLARSVRFLKKLYRLGAGG